MKKKIACENIENPPHYFSIIFNVPEIFTYCPELAKGPKLTIFENQKWPWNIINSFLIDLNHFRILSIVLKFRYCEKATKLKKYILPLLKLLTKLKSKWDIFSNFCGLLRISELYRSMNQSCVYSFVLIAKVAQPNVNFFMFSCKSNKTLFTLWQVFSSRYATPQLIYATAPALGQVP